MTGADPSDERDPRYLFVVGSSRSGTTMMSRVLGLHPEVHAFEELHFFEKLWSPSGSGDPDEAEARRIAERLLGVEREGLFAGAGREVHAAEAAQLVSGLPPHRRSPTEVYRAFLLGETRRHGRRVPCEQTPRNVFYLHEILELLPGARIVNLVRDPRDVVLSQKNKWRRRHLGGREMPLGEALRSWVNYHPTIIGRLWRASVAAADAFAGHPAVLSLRFEDLLTEPERHVRRVCELAGLIFDPAMLRVPQVGSSAFPDRPDQLGMRPDAAGRWREGELGAAEVYLTERAVGPLLAAHGYEPSGVRANPLVVAGYRTLCPLRLGGAFALNFRRMRNLRDTVRRRLMAGNA